MVDIGQAVGKPFPSEHAARGRLLNTLFTLEHGHVVDFASWLEYSRHHSDQEELSDLRGVRGGLRPHIGRKP